jgi:integrase
VVSKLRSRFASDADVSDERVCPTSTWEHRASWDAIKAEAKVKDLRWHDLRHTYASRLAMTNVNVLTIQRLMRHQTSRRHCAMLTSHLVGCTKTQKRSAPAQV